MGKRVGVGVLGSGLLAEQYLTLLKNHPWFELRFHGNAEKIEAIDKAKRECRFIFSALSDAKAQIYEPLYAGAGIGVISNAGYHRSHPEVPLVIPEVNGDHLSLVLGKEGFIVTKPNCSIQSYLIPLAPLHKAFRVRKIHVTTLQAISGAGNVGLSSYQIQDNVIPYISGEEEKSQVEPLKIWGRISNGKIIPAKNISISAHCNRVPVLHGHMACVSVQFAEKPTLEQIVEAWRSFPGLSLPSAPRTPILYREEVERPQTRLDRDYEKGMGVTVGRLRPCPLLHYRFVGLSHNTIRGGAGGGILIAEMLIKKDDKG